MKIYNDLFLKRINIVSISLLVTFGILLNVSASSVQGLNLYNDNFFFIKRHLLAVIIGVFLFNVLKNFDIKTFSKFSPMLMGLSAVSLFYVLIYGIVVGGSRRWIDLGPINLQPSEISKPIILLWVACQVTLKHKNENDLKVLLRTLFLPLTCATLIFLEPDYGTFATICFIIFIQIFFSKVKFIIPASVVAVFTPILYFLANSSDYRVKRIQTWFSGKCDLGQDLLGDCFQLNQSRIAISSGGLFGLGPGTSRARWGSLPNAYSDFIASIVGEEYGFFGMFVLVSLFFLLITSTYLIGIRESSKIKQLFIIGFASWILFQTIINLGGAVGLIPITGMVLPFISYGSTAMVSIFVGLGIMYSSNND